MGKWRSDGRVNDDKKEGLVRDERKNQSHVERRDSFTQPYRYERAQENGTRRNQSGHDTGARGLQQWEVGARGNTNAQNYVARGLQSGHDTGARGQESGARGQQGGVRYRPQRSMSHGPIRSRSVTRSLGSMALQAGVSAISTVASWVAQDNVAAQQRVRHSPNQATSRALPRVRPQHVQPRMGFLGTPEGSPVEQPRASLHDGQGSVLTKMLENQERMMAEIRELREQVEVLRNSIVSSTEQARRERSVRVEYVDDRENFRPLDRKGTGAIGRKASEDRRNPDDRPLPRPKMGGTVARNGWGPSSKIDGGTPPRNVSPSARWGTRSERTDVNKKAWTVTM